MAAKRLRRLLSQLLAPRTRTRSLILVPLAVMMLLTFLMGMTSFRITEGWEKTVNEVTQQLTENLIVNNVYWRLRLIEEILPTDPQKAQDMWDTLQAQAKPSLPVAKNTNLFTRSMPVALKIFLSDPQNIANIEAFLNREQLSWNLDDVQRQLNTMKGYANTAALLTTISMMLLGFVLLAIMAIDLTRLFDALESSRDLATLTQEEERQRIAQELHDGVIQQLIDLKRDYQPQKVDNLVNIIRRICYNLRPQILDDLGIVPALEFLADELREHDDAQGLNRIVALSLEEDGLRCLPKSYELPLFRIIQELFNNIKKHAHATEVKLTVVYHPDESPMLRLYLRDNGRGFNPLNLSKDRPGGMGLKGIQERVLRFGGHVSIDSAQGQGTRVQLLIPIIES